LGLVSRRRFASGGGNTLAFLCIYWLSLALGRENLGFSRPSALAFLGFRRPRKAKESQGGSEIDASAGAPRRRHVFNIFQQARGGGSRALPAPHNVNRRAGAKPLIARETGFRAL